jgi:hypothetical protein
MAVGSGRCKVQSDASPASEEFFDGVVKQTTEISHHPHPRQQIDNDALAFESRDGTMTSFEAHQTTN